MNGRIVGSYEIVERLGEGGMGTVYRAVDTMLEREVAIKAIRPELAAEPQIVERFRSEAKILARVRHPAIATIYSFFKDPASGELFLAMELVHGRTLSQVLRAEGALAWPRAVALTRAALEGIEEVHRTGIIHRDLKPDNLMLTEPPGTAGSAGGTGIKVMDFGIARSLGSDHLTRTGLMVGTLRYMSPEQLRGQEVDPRSDLYSMGIVLYEMLTGRVPFTGGSEYESMRAQVEDPPPSPRSLVPGLPVWLDQAVLTALAKDPGQRFQSAADMAACLASGTWSTNPPPGLPARPALPDLPTVARPTPAGPVPVLPVQPAIDRPAPGAASSYQIVDSRGIAGFVRRRWPWLAAGLAALGIAGLAVAWMSSPRPAPAATAATAAVGPPAAGPAPRSQPVPATPIVQAQVAQTPIPISAGEPAPLAPPATLAPKPLPRRPPATPAPLPAPAASPATPAPTLEEPAAAATPTPAPAEAPIPDEPGPAGPVPEDPAVFQQLGKLGNELEAANAKLVDAFEEYRGQQKDRNEALTPAEEKLKLAIDALVESTTRFNRRANASFFRRGALRLALEGTQKQRLEMIQRGHEVAKNARQLQMQMVQTHPPAAVRQAGQEVGRICREIALLARHPRGK